jgi:hypothetical protein
LSSELEQEPPQHGPQPPGAVSGLHCRGRRGKDGHRHAEPTRNRSVRAVLVARLARCPSAAVRVIPRRRMAWRTPPPPPGPAPRPPPPCRALSLPAVCVRVADAAGAAGIDADALAAVAAAATASDGAGAWGRDLVVSSFKFEWLCRLREALEPSSSSWRRPCESMWAVVRRVQPEGASARSAMTCWCVRPMPQRFVPQRFVRALGRRLHGLSFEPQIGRAC